MIKNLGVQLYSIRDYIKTAEDIRLSFKKLKDIGYSEVQTAGSGEISYEEMAEIAKECGIKVQGTHYKYSTMLEDLEKTVREHKALGTNLCGVGGGMRYMGTTREGVESYIKQVNKLADRLYEHGLKFTYHNHHREFNRLDGEDISIMDMLVEGLNPEKTSFVLDTFWVATAGGDVCQWIEKLKGRIDIIHLKDRGFTTVDYGAPDERGRLIQLDYKEIGKGNLNWDGIMKACEKAGVKYYCVEHDDYFIDNDPFKSLKVSADFLKKYMRGIENDR